MRDLTAVLVLTWLLGGCASPPQAIDVRPRTAIPGFSALTLIPSDNPAFAWRALVERTPSALEAWSGEEESLREACNAAGPRPNGKESPSAVLAPGPGPAIAWQPMLADPLLDAAFRRHAAVASQSARRPFYADPERRLLEPAWRCFRFVAFAGPDDIEPLLDFVGELRLGDSGDYLQVRPLRLFVAAAARERRIALGLRVDAVWRDGHIGRQGTVFEPVLMAARLVSGTDTVDYFLDRYWEHHPILPLAPVSVDTRGRTLPTAPATVTVTALVIGDAENAPPALLHAARAAGDMFGNLIVAALQSR